MKNLLTTAKRVENAMLEYPETRADDFKLVSRVYEQILGRIEYIRFWELMQHHIEYGLPSFESITRARRKILAKFPELRDAKATEIRLKEQEKYLEYSKM